MNRCAERSDYNSPARRLSGLIVLAASLLLSACGGGGGGGGGTPSNAAPTASFTVTPMSGAAPLPVAVDASASSDPEGAIASYSWNFGDSSPAVTGVTTNHTYTTANTYTITLTVRDSGGKTASTTHSVAVSAGPPPTSVTVSGKITYDRVPFKAGLGTGLNYGGIVQSPARGIVVQLVQPTSPVETVLSTTDTDSAGNYSFASAPVNTSVFVRARAQSRSTGPATWDIQVKNNTNGKALYVMDGASFNTGVANQTKNYNAQSGWPELGVGTSYAGPRVAAPFAILDSLYSAVQYVVTQGDSAIALPLLEVFWSPANKSSNTFTPGNGSISTTLYQAASIGGWPPGIYVLGDDGVDTDEYDEHVLTHEFNHFLIDTVSRDDTPGGSHSGSEHVDMRLAFSEGFGNAFSAFSLGDPVYRDSFGPKQGGDFGPNLEANSATPKGWFGELSVGSILWDIVDSGADTGDTVTVPYSAVLNVLRNQVRNGQPLTSIFPFIVALKVQVPAQAAAIDTLVANQSIVAATMDPFGTTEVSNGGNTDALPLYMDATLNGPAVVTCGNDTNGLYNKIGNRRYVKFTLNAARSVTIKAQFAPPPTSAEPSTSAGIPRPDPDLILRSGLTGQVSDTSTADIETFSPALGAGNYVLEVYEFSHIEAPGSPQASRGRTCYSVTITG